MTKYCVKFFRETRTIDCMSIVVEASDALSARAKVHGYFSGTTDDKLSDEEILSETLEKEEILDSIYDGLMDASEPYAVAEV